MERRYEIMPTILDGLKVLDLTEGMAGSLATMVLSDNGADVVKIERPKGDPYRTTPAWIMWNRGKKSVVLDIHTKTDQDQIKKLATNSDVLIENFKPGIFDSLGLGYQDLSKLNPSLIYCSMTSFGSEGPYKKFKPYNGITEAKSGSFLPRGRAGSRPVYRVRPRGDYGSAMMMVQGIAAALRVRDMTGKGQRLESTTFAAVVFTDSSGATARQAELGMMADGLGGRTRTVGSVNLSYLNVRCKDGQWLQLANLTTRLFANLMRVSGLEWIYQDPRFKSAPRIENREEALEMRRLIYQAMQAKTLDEWLKIFKDEDVCGDQYLTTQQAMDHPYISELNGVVSINDPHVGETQQIGPLVRFAKTPSEIHRPSPLLGEHTKDILQSLDGAKNNPTNPLITETGESNIPKHPFEGMLLLDFSTFNAAPQGASLIADLGARVIKVEGPTSEDAPGGKIGKGRTFQSKENMVVDLKTPEGRKIMAKLIAKADGMLHNMRGNTPSRLGLDYETVSKINPNIVYLYAASYGSSGPGAGRAAFHPIAGCLSGGPLWQLGKGNGMPPCDSPLTIEEIEEWSEKIMAANESLPDQNSAKGVGTALALALYHKSRTGEGQYLESHMVVSNLYLCSDDFIRYQGKPDRLEPDKDLNGLHALHRLYETKEGWVFLTAPLDEEWENLCKALSRLDLINEPRFNSHLARLRHDEALTAILWPIFRNGTADEWESYLTKFDVACARADGLRYEDFLLTDPGIKEAGLVVDVEHSTTGKMKRVSPAIHFSMTPGRAAGPHILGEDTSNILKELGNSLQEITDLRTKGIIN
jgi:crotonobetainyl-CoA:carnitine CoA-transferase CaiB-like acyl-CoA transferase